MENNQKDFMKNRPVAAPANQIKDVYGSQKKSTRTTVTALLIAVMTAIIVIALICGNSMITLIFSPILLLLLVSLIVGYRADKSNTPVTPVDHPDAIFKEHEER